jgi:hypothetical protein
VKIAYETTRASAAHLRGLGRPTNRPATAVAPCRRSSPTSTCPWTPADERRATAAVELAKTWPTWRASYDERVAYQRALDKAWHEPEASTRALAMAARHAAANDPWAKTS